MTAGTVLFLIDALLVALSWPAAIKVFHDPASPFQIASFALFDLLFLYALGFYRRDNLADLGRANRRAPLSVALAYS